MKTVEELKKLYRADPENKELALAYAAALCELSYDQSVEESAQTIKKLRRLYKRHKDDAAIRAEYSKGLLTRYQLRRLQKEERALEQTVAELRGAWETDRENEEAALDYANALADLIWYQEGTEALFSAERLREQYEAHRDSEAFAAAYAWGLLNLAVNQGDGLREKAGTVALLRELYRAYPDSKEIRQRVAQGLFHLAGEQTPTEAAQTLERLEELCAAYPEDEESAAIYENGMENLRFDLDRQPNA